MSKSEMADVVLVSPSRSCTFPDLQDWPKLKDGHSTVQAGKPHFLLVIACSTRLYYVHIQPSGYSAGSRCSGPFKAIASPRASVRGDTVCHLLLTPWTPRADAHGGRAIRKVLLFGPRRRGRYPSRRIPP